MTTNPMHVYKRVISISDFNKEHGEVAIFSNKKFSTKSLDLNKYIAKGEPEYCGILLNQLCLDALTVHRPSRAREEIFLKNLECVLDVLMGKSKNIVVFGDFNFDFK